MRIWRKAGMGLVLAAAGALAQAQDAWPTQGWATSTPESQGVDSRALEALLEFGAANQMDSVLVTRHGRLVLDAYYGPFEDKQLHAVNSATKVVTAALVGLAIAEGKLPPATTPVLALVPGRTVANIDERKRALQLQHLLDMDSGIAWIEPLADAVPQTALKMYESRDWAQFVLDQPMAQAPGAGFNYNSGNSQLASALLAQAVGASTEAYAAKELFAPLGIREWRWRKDPTGVSTGGFGLALQPRDLARIGLLYLRHGEWEGRQLLPRAWVDRTFQATLPMNPAPGAEYRYANGWWTLPERGAFMAVGFHRQLAIVLPREDVVAVVTGRYHYRIEDLLDRLQAATKAPAPLPEDAAAQQALAANVQALAAPAASPPVADSPLVQKISGRSWKAQRNPLGIQQFTFRWSERPELELVVNGRKEVLKLAAQGAPVRSVGSRGVALTRAVWRDEATLAIATRFVNEGETGTYVLRFDGDRVDVHFTYTMGFEASFSAQAAD